MGKRPNRKSGQGRNGDYVLPITARRKEKDLYSVRLSPWQIGLLKNGRGERRGRKNLGRFHRTSPEGKVVRGGIYVRKKQPKKVQGNNTQTQKA